MALITGTNANNILEGTTLDDVLAGGAGDDVLKGRSGNDTAWYLGALAGYRISSSGSRIIVQDIAPADGNEGRDSLQEIEALQFSNARLQIGADVLVNTNTTGNQSQSSVASLADGGYVVTWTDSSSVTLFAEIYAQRFDAFGQKTGGEFKVNTTTAGNQSLPQVTGLADGGFVVVWQGPDVANNGIFAQRYDGSGAALGLEFQVNTTTALSQVAPMAFALADGGFVVVWVSPDGSNDGVFLRRYDAFGTGGIETAVNNVTTGQQDGPSATLLSNGTYVVVFDGPDAGGDGIYARLFNDDGPLLNAFAVNVTTANEQIDPDVASLANGGFVVTWRSDFQDGSVSGVFARVFDNGGIALSDEIGVNQFTLLNQSNSSVAGLKNGGFVVTWESTYQDDATFYTGVYARRFDATGNALGDEFRVASRAESDQYASSVSALEDGGFVVSWTSAGQDDPNSASGSGIYSQRYDAEGNAQGLKLTGTAAADVISLGDGEQLAVDGAGGNDILNGGATSDVLLGGIGNDILNGNAGDDSLDGGTGADRMTGGAGNDTYVVDNAADVIVEAAGGGIDSVFSSVARVLGASEENLTLTGTGSINGTGNAVGNILYGNSGDNTLNGGAGADIMAAGQGNDVYVVDNEFDFVSEEFNAGTDRVDSSVSYTLGSNQENLTLTGAGSTNGTGNFQNNNIVGNAAANVIDGLGGNDNLNGMAGNDTLVGGAGNDTLTGGLGNDILQGGSDLDVLNGGAGNDILTGGDSADQFIFDAPLSATTNLDHITDFVATQDEIRLDKTIFTALSTANLDLDPLMFRSGAGVNAAADADDRIIYNTTTGDLYYDANGSVAGGSIRIAVIDNKPPLSAGDFFVTA